MQANYDFKYDLKLGQIYEKKLANLLENKKIEVKTDFKAHKTGRVFVEFESRGKWSGIYHTESDLYAFVIVAEYSVDAIVILPTTRLIRLARAYIERGEVYEGGDNKTSKGVLIPVKELVTW